MRQPQISEVVFIRFEQIVHDCCGDEEHHRLLSNLFECMGKKNFQLMEKIGGNHVQTHTSGKGTCVIYFHDCAASEIKVYSFAVIPYRNGGEFMGLTAAL